MKSKNLRRVLLLSVIITLTAMPVSFARGDSKDDTVKGSDNKYGNTDAKKGGGQELREETKSDKDSERLMNQNQIKDQTRTKAMIKEQLGTCTKTCEEVKTMTQNKNESKEQQIKITEKVKTMIKANDDLTTSLGDKEKDQIKTQLKEMEKIQTRLKAHVNDMEKEIASDNPSQSKIQNKIKEMKKETVKLENQYRAMEWIVKED